MYTGCPEIDELKYEQILEKLSKIYCYKFLFYTVSFWKSIKDYV